MSRFILKTLLRGLLILLVVPLLLLLLVVGLLSNETVNHWLAGKASDIEPRLQLDFTGGQLWRGWEFSRINWADDSLDLTLENVQFSWSPSCLRGRRLCIDLLAVEKVTVLTQPDDEPSPPRENIELPTIQLPIGIQLREIKVGSVWLNGENALLRDISLQAQASGNQLHIAHFRGQGPDLTWALEGDIRLTDGWPLRFTADLDLPPVDGRPWELHARASGSVAELDLEARSTGYLPGILTVRAQPLLANLPLRAHWQGQSFLALDTLPKTLTLNDLNIDLIGNLEQGLALNAKGVLPGEGGPVNLSLLGKMMTTGVSDLTLQLKVADKPERELSLTADADWTEELTADAKLAMQDFPWQWLYPQDIGDINIERLAMEASLRGEQFDADLRADLTGVGNEKADLQLSLAGTPDEVTVAPLALTTTDGRLTGEAVIGLIDGVSWNADLLLQELNPGIFVAELPGVLNGPITSQGSIKDELMELSAAWDVSGTLRKEPLALSGALAAKNNEWQVNDLLLQQGENRVSGAGNWGESVSGKLDIALTQLQTLWPGLYGRLTGSVTASGPSTSPQIALDLQGRRIGFEELSLAELNLDGQLTLDEQMPGNLKLTIIRLRSGDTRVGNLALNLTGNKAAHDLSLDLEGGIVELDTHLSGQLTDERWAGRLTSGTIVSEDMAWQLKTPAPLSYQLANSDMRMGAHCWEHLTSSLCFTGEQKLMPDRDLNVKLSDFPLASLQEWLPEDFTWNGTLDASAQLQQKAGAQPRGTVAVSSRNGEIKVSNPDEELVFPYEQLEFTTQLEADHAKSNLTLISEGLGNLNAQADITDPGGTQNLKGQFQLNDLHLDVLRPFLPQVDVLKGELLGSGTLVGTLSDPYIQGKIRLSDGEISGPELPVSFEQLQVNLTIAGQQADIEGEWVSGKGQGRLQGSAAWAPALMVDIALTGTDLPILVDPYADLLASPDLHIGLADNNLEITGTIAIPEGEITVRELPESAVKLSPDAVIVGAAEPEEQELPLGISANVTLAIGDQLHFSGFGLSGRLSGLLEVKENMTATGDLNILDGRFRGYGQRLQLRRAQILFAGPISQPYLDIEAIRKVDDVVAGLRLTGPADAPISEVFSEPSMAQEQALAYLILGRPLGADGGDSNLLGQAALALGMAGSTPLAKNVAESLGIDDFQLDTEGSGLTTSVVATGYLTEKLSLRYGVGVFEQANQLALRYDLTKRLYLEAVGGLASSLDFFYRIDF